ncbi:MAG: 16S rRNA (cytosine(1402)-N(4))-methyltransferase RsmH [Anaerolineae bacterium]|nr:16S rRNA (cytosine(1402)-N(4))-methyltransferase RsmH [Anaerolineae bacterium]
MTSSSDAPHIPVLLPDVLALFDVRPGAAIIDATVGAGGHAAALLEAAGPRGRLLGIDQDQGALALAGEWLRGWGGRVTLVHARFDTLAKQAAAVNFPAADAILMDLGVSSMHLDDATRGFSFLRDGPLDMRMNVADPGPTAADLVNTLDEDELADLIWKYGEEPQRRRIARAIVQQRPFTRTTELAKTVESVIKRRPGDKLHPATLTFQALRIVVNDELGALERVLPQAVALLKPGGRLGVISFHSLEDRIVKRFFKQEASDCICPPEQPVCTCGHKATLSLLTRKPIMADEAETTANPRSRSARLRGAEKL